MIFFAIKIELVIHFIFTMSKSKQVKATVAAEAINESSGVTLYPADSTRYTIKISASASNEANTGNESRPEYNLAVMDTETYDKFIAQLDYNFYKTLSTRIFNADNVIALLRDMCGRHDYEIIVDEHKVNTITARFSIVINTHGITIDDELKLYCDRTNEDATVREVARITAQLDRLVTHVTEIYDSSQKVARTVAMQDMFTRTERIFGRIAQPQYEFAAKLFSAELDNDPIVFPIAYSWANNTDTRNGDSITCIPLYARSVIRVVNTAHTCLLSLQYVTCERLIITHIKQYENKLQSSYQYYTKKIESYVSDMHNRWHSFDFGANQLVLPREWNHKPSELIFVENHKDSTMIAVISNAKPYLTNMRIIIDERMGYTDLSGIFANVEIVNFADRKAVDYNITPAMRAYMERPNMCKDIVTMSCSQWYGV